MLRRIAYAGALSLALICGCSHDLDSLRGGSDSGAADSSVGDSGARDSGTPDSGPAGPCWGLAMEASVESAPAIGSPSAGLLLGPPSRQNVWRFELAAPMLVREIGFVGSNPDGVALQVAIFGLSVGEDNPPPGPVTMALVGPVSFASGSNPDPQELSTEVDASCLEPGWYAITVTNAEDGASSARISGGHSTASSAPDQPYVRTPDGTSTQSRDVRIFARGRQ